MNPWKSTVYHLVLIFVMSGWAADVIGGSEGEGRLHVRVLDAAGKPVPSRVHLTDAHGAPVRGAALPFWYDHFVCDGSVELDLGSGRYTYTVERGPEYPSIRGELHIERGQMRTIVVDLSRRFDMAAEGWWSGDLHVHRPLEEVELLMRAADLHVAPVITWWNHRDLWADRPIPEQTLVRFDGDRYYDVMAGEDERIGGAILFFHNKTPVHHDPKDLHHPPSMRFFRSVKNRVGGWVEIEKPMWWDVPIWLAGGADSIGVAHNLYIRPEERTIQDWIDWAPPFEDMILTGKHVPEDKGLYPATRPWTELIYFHALNAGIRIAPSAGSASGVLPSPVGFNRVYVYLEKGMDYDAWWRGLKNGRCFVTNGPLLRCRANDELPGHVFEARRGGSVSLELHARIDSTYPIRRVEVVRDGRVVRKITGEQWQADPRLGAVEFDRSGWCLVQVISDSPYGERFAATAPFHVEIGRERRVSRGSVRFFLDWLDARERHIDQTYPHGKMEARREVVFARRFFEKLLDRANAR